MLRSVPDSVHPSGLLERSYHFLWRSRLHLLLVAFAYWKAIQNCVTQTRLFRESLSGSINFSSEIVFFFDCWLCLLHSLRSHSVLRVRSRFYFWGRSVFGDRLGWTMNFTRSSCLCVCWLQKVLAPWKRGNQYWFGVLRRVVLFYSDAIWWKPI